MHRAHDHPQSSEAPGWGVPNPTASTHTGGRVLSPTSTSTNVPKTAGAGVEPRTPEASRQCPHAVQVVSSGRQGHQGKDSNTGKRHMDPAWEQVVSGTMGGTRTDAERKGATSWPCDTVGRTQHPFSHEAATRRSKC